MVTGILKTSEAPWCCLIGLLLEEEESDSEMSCGSFSAGACSHCLGLMGEQQDSQLLSSFSTSSPVSVPESGHTCSRGQVGMDMG